MARMRSLALSRANVRGGGGQVSYAATILAFIGGLQQAAAVVDRGESAAPLVVRVDAAVPIANRRTQLRTCMCMWHAACA